jgi:hypothetical protein
MTTIYYPIFTMLGMKLLFFLHKPYIILLNFLSCMLFLLRNYSHV